MPHVLSDIENKGDILLLELFPLCVDGTPCENTLLAVPDWKKRLGNAFFITGIWPDPQTHTHTPSSYNAAHTQRDEDCVSGGRVGK